MPSGISLDDVEKAILSQIKKELGETFKKWELESLTIVLKVEKGKVQRIQIKKYKGKKCEKKVLQSIFKKIHFSASLKGTLELNLKYM